MGPAIPQPAALASRVCDEVRGLRTRRGPAGANGSTAHRCRHDPARRGGDGGGAARLGDGRDFADHLLRGRVHVGGYHDGRAAADQAGFRRRRQGIRAGYAYNA